MRNRSLQRILLVVLTVVTSVSMALALDILI